MKLELKHLAPYLPYGLKIHTMDDDERSVIQTIKNLAFTRVVGQYSIETSDGWDVGYGEFKPLLIPLSELTKEFVSQYDWAYPDNVIGHCKSGAIDVKTWNALVEAHFDVFSLIPAGLALNKLDHI